MGQLFFRRDGFFQLLVDGIANRSQAFKKLAERQDRKIIQRC